MIFTKGAHQRAEYQTFDCSGEISPNFYIDRLVLLKVCKMSAKKVQTSYIYLMTLKSDAKFEEKPICCLKNDKTLINSDRALKSLKNVPFYCSLSCKVYTDWPKKKIKLTCGLENDMMDLANFHEKCQNWYFHGILLSKVQNAWAKNI